MEEKLKIHTSHEHLASKLSLFFKAIENDDSKYKVSFFNIAITVFLLSILLCLIIKFNIYNYLYLFLALVMLLFLFHWKYISFKIYTLFREDVRYYVPYYKDKGEKEHEYSFLSGENLILKDNIERELRSNSAEGKAYYIGLHKNEEIKKEDLISLIKFTDAFSDLNQVNLFFVVSFFTMNILYSIMILSLIIWTKMAHEGAIYTYLTADLSRAIYIVIILLFFSLAIFKFLKYLLPIDENSKNLIYEHSKLDILDKIEIYETNFEDIKKVKLNDLKRLVEKVDKKLDEKKTNIFQIATPIFFLAYVSLVISYFVEKS